MALVEVKGLIDAADPELNIMLVGGEEIRVPEIGKVFVVGMVKKKASVFSKYLLRALKIKKPRKLILTIEAFL